MVRPLIIYDAETITITEKLRIIERKTVRSIMGPKGLNKNEDRVKKQKASGFTLFQDYKRVPNFKSN